MPSTPIYHNYHRKAFCLWCHFKKHLIDSKLIKSIKLIADGLDVKFTRDKFITDLLQLTEWYDLLEFCKLVGFKSIDSAGITQTSYWQSAEHASSMLHVHKPRPSGNLNEFTLVEDQIKFLSNFGLGHPDSYLGYKHFKRCLCTNRLIPWINLGFSIDTLQQQVITRTTVFEEAYSISFALLDLILEQNDQFYY